MSDQVTVVVVPRDRFSSVIACTESILKNTDVPFRILFLDFGYDARTLRKLMELCAKVKAEIIYCGRTIPMVAFKNVINDIQTPYTAWVDNDTYVTEGWMTALLMRAELGARVVFPVTLERDGVDEDPRKISLRNHISHAVLRSVKVGDRQYVFDHKPFRRVAPEKLPQRAHKVDYFELHTFLAETNVLRELDIPEMVVREHIDIGIQLHRLGIDIICEPTAVVHFDNIHERPSYRDLRFFFYRWDENLINDSHQRFEQRWGYQFYNEQFLKNWAYRRKVFSVCRYLGLPSKLANYVSRALNRLFRQPIPQGFIKDPLPESKRVLKRKIGKKRKESAAETVEEKLTQVM